RAPRFIASPHRLTHSTLKGPSRELTSERRTAVASAASDRTRSTFRDTGLPRPRHCGFMSGCAKLPGGLCASVHRGFPRPGLALSGPPHRPALGCRRMLGHGTQELSPKRNIPESYVTVVAAGREESSARRSTRLGSSAFAGTLRAG